MRLHVPLMNSLSYRFHDVLPALPATVVETSLNPQCLVQLGIIPFKEMHLVQNVKLVRPVLILLSHQNTALVALTAKRFVYAMADVSCCFFHLVISLSVVSYFEPIW